MGHNLALTTELDLYVVNCGECGGVYAILERVRQQKHKEGSGWTCPYCKTGWGYYGNGENARLKRELEMQRKRTEWAEQDARRKAEAVTRAGYALRAQKAAKTRIKNRIGKGVCPSCNRTFENLQRHMACKHPDYGVEQ